MPLTWDALGRIPHRHDPTVQRLDLNARDHYPTNGIRYRTQPKILPRRVYLIASRGDCENSNLSTTAPETSLWKVDDCVVTY